jgi:hypothetical protein
MLDDIEPQHEAVQPRKRLQTVNRALRTSTETIRVAVGDEDALEARFDHVAQRVVHDPIAEWRGADPPALRFMDREMDVGAGSIPAFFQLVLETKQFVGKSILKLRRSGSTTLAAYRFAMSEQ